MEKSFEIIVLSPDHSAYKGSAVSVVLPGELGSFGVLQGHIPLISSLRIGYVVVTPADGSPPVLIAVGEGFVEVSRNKVTVLVDVAEEAERIDMQRAMLAKARAEERIQKGGPDLDVDRASAALSRALNRLKVGEMAKKRTGAVTETARPRRDSDSDEED